MKLSDIFKKIHDNSAKGSDKQQSIDVKCSQVTNRLIQDRNSAAKSYNKQLEIREALIQASQTKTFDSDTFKFWNKDYLQRIATDETEMQKAIYKASEEAKRCALSIHRFDGELTFLRPNTEADIAEREDVGKFFAKKISEIDPNEVTNLFFHATPIWATFDILESGGVFSSVDRYQNDALCPGFVQTTNASNEISVSNLTGMQYSLDYWADLGSSAINDMQPAGCIFVLRPNSQEELEMTKNWQMHNVNFHNQPDKFFGIITTEENKARVQEWMHSFGLDESKVFTYKEFPDVLRAEVLAIESEKFMNTSDMVFGSAFEGNHILDSSTDIVSLNNWKNRNDFTQENELEFA